MRKAIFTIMIGSDPSYQYAHRTFEQYAKKVGADLIKSTSPHYTLNKNKLRCKQKHTAWFEKIYIQELLKQYDRVLYIDADILITPDAPDIFSLCSDENRIYMINEGFYASREKQINQILSLLPLEKEWPVVGQYPVYCNSGVMLISKEANLFSYVNQEELILLLSAKVSMFEQTYFNYLRIKHDIELGDLPKEFNRLSMFGQKDYLKSYFIHYAGGGFCRSLRLRYRTMIQDYQRLYNKPSSSFLKQLQLWKADFQFIIYEIKKSFLKLL